MKPSLGLDLGLGGYRGSPYSILDEPELLVYWDADTVPIGTLTSWVDRKAGLALTPVTGTTTKSATAFTDMFGGTHPGVIFNSSLLSCAAFGAVVLGRTSLTMMASMQDGATAGAIAIELSSNALATNGAFWLSPNDGGSLHTLEWLMMGAPGQGPGTWRSTNNVASLIDPGVVACRFDTTTGFGTSVRELDGVSLDGFQLATAALNPPSTMPNQPLYVGARAGLVAPWVNGRIRDLAFFTGNGDVAMRRRVARSMGERVKAPQA